MVDIYPEPAGERPKIPPPLGHTDATRARLAPAAKSNADVDEILNTTTSAPGDVMLDSHVLYMQEVKKW